MLSRKVLLVASLLVLLVEGDLEPQHLHPDTDSTSEEAPTDVLQHHSGHPPGKETPTGKHRDSAAPGGEEDALTSNQVSVAVASSVEDDDDGSQSAEGAGPHSLSPPQSTAHLPLTPTHSPTSPLAPQPRVQGRGRTSRRRSRTSRT
ncbi:uncharacterized protein LOC142877059 isoform X1 [Nelusetta ayraudi]|uniref:uncharacterized protein LOC142877059 isoform X1 n=1 Tax=Nelusetta ayraudi TaxID=303726 RepID=UPI003F72A15D